MSGLIIMPCTNSALEICLVIALLLLPFTRHLTIYPRMDLFCWTSCNSLSFSAIVLSPVPICYYQQNLVYFTVCVLNVLFHTVHITEEILPEDKGRGEITLDIIQVLPKLCDIRIGLVLQLVNPFIYLVMVFLDILLQVTLDCFNPGTVTSYPIIDLVERMLDQEYQDRPAYTEYSDQRYKLFCPQIDRPIVHTLFPFIRTGDKSLPDRIQGFPSVDA
nr:MAG TPA: hypothetical protein [Caudoviricetes sp.]